MNTPKQLIKYIEPYAENKVVCDLGAHQGEFLSQLKNCKSRIAFDKSEDNCKKALERGIEQAMFGDYYKDPIPKADVYYVYTHSYDVGRVYKKIKKGTIIFTGPKEHFDEPANKFRGEVPKFIRKHQSRKDIKFKSETKEHKKLNNYIWTIVVIKK